MNEAKFGRILETGMGFIMSWVLNTTALYLSGASMTLNVILPSWTGAFAVAVAINYFCPVMSWVAPLTKGITNNTLEYIVRVFIFAFILIVFNSAWCMYMVGSIALWPNIFLKVLPLGLITVYIAMPIMEKIAAALAQK